VFLDERPEFGVPGDQAGHLLLFGLAIVTSMGKSENKTA
jgi:hypothetical protein